MQIDAPLKLPFLSKKKSVKDQVISSLSTKKSMSGKELHEKIIQENGRIMTYQALYKVLKTLENEGIISKHEKNFELNPEWIKSLKDYASTIDYLYANDSSKIQIPKDLAIPFIIEFTDLTIFPVTMANLFASCQFTDGKQLPSYGFLHHGWWPLRFNFHDFILLKQMQSKNPGSKCAIIGNSPFDQWIVKHYRAAGMTVNCGVQTDLQDCDIAVHGDVILQIYHSEEAKKLIDDLYSKINDIGDLFNFYVHNKINEQKVKVKVVIQRNPAIARLFRDKIENLLKID